MDDEALQRFWDNIEAVRVFVEKSRRPSVQSGPSIMDVLLDLLDVMSTDALLTISLRIANILEARKQAAK